MTDTTTNQQYLPWDWTLTSQDSESAHCPSSSTILGTYAVVNVVVAVVSLALGHKKVTQFLTFGCFGKEGNKAYLFTWIFPCGLQLGANAINAYIIRNTPGYESDFSISEMMLFLTTRPRLAFIFLAAGVVATDSSRSGDEESEDLFDKDESDSPFISALMSCWISELVLQAIACYTMGRVANLARIKGYYIVTSDIYRTVPHWAHVMYASAILYLIGAGFIVLVGFPAIISHGATLSLVVFAVIYLWFASWLFWAGFLRLSGSYYCPPQMFAQGGVWAVFSALGILLGGSGAA